MDPDQDADPDPSIYIIDLQDANKKLIRYGTLLLHNFSKKKNQKEVTK
jgi:hypothetical protein